MAAKPTTIDEYLATVSEDQRVALEKLRKAIKAAAPRAEECISYGLAAFRLDGKPLVGFGATPKHCAFYPMSSSTVESLQEELTGYDTSKGTIRFLAAKPLPAALVRKVVKARIAESSSQAGASKRAAKSDPAVAAFLKELEHPLKSVIEAVRRLILAASPEICEGIKWNSPSFRTTEFFATLNLRDGRVWLILHTGAKVKANATKGIDIADPASLLQWLAKDRALVTFNDDRDFKTKRTALQSLIRAWIKLL